MECYEKCNGHMNPIRYAESKGGETGNEIEIRSANEAIISGYVNAVERDSKVLPKTMSPNAKTKFVEN